MMCHVSKYCKKMDVATVRSENANLRKIQQKLLQWDSLAPLTTNQLDFLEQLNEICDGGSKADVSYLVSTDCFDVVIEI